MSDVPTTEECDLLADMVRELANDLQSVLIGRPPEVCLTALIDVIACVLTTENSDEEFERQVAATQKFVAESAERYRGDIVGWDLKH